MATSNNIHPVIVLGTVNQLRSAPDIVSVQVAGASLSTSDHTLKSVGVVLDQRLTFHDHVNVVKSCNYHTRAIRHIRHLLTQSAAQTLVRSLINSRLDYCNSLLLGAPAMSLNRLQRAQDIAARVVYHCSIIPMPLQHPPNTTAHCDYCFDAP